MTTFNSLSVGFVILVIIIVVIIVALWKWRRDSHRRRTDRRFSVEGERFKVERSHRSSSSSTADDGFISGGLGEICVISGNLNTCAAGLACEGQRCVCPRPSSPVVTAIESGIDTIVATWAPVLGADFYNVVLYRVISPTMVDPVEIVNGLRATVITFNNLAPGNYRVEVIAGSDVCGVLPDAVAGTATITVGCTANNQCSGATPFCQAGTCVQCSIDANCPAGQACHNGTCAIVTGQGLLQTCSTTANCASGLLCTNNQCVCPPTPLVQPSITLGPQPSSVIVSWPQTPGVDVYRVELRRQCTPVPLATTCFSEIVAEDTIVNTPGVTAVTFGGLEPGVTYFAQLFTGTVACGISATTQPSTSPTITLPCLPFVFTSAGRVAQSFLSPHNTRVVTVFWDPPTPKPDAYRVFIQDNTGGAFLAVLPGLIQPEFSIPLTAGFKYTIAIFPFTATCDPDLGVAQPLRISFFVSPNRP
jgi:hypothetical protein